MEYQASRYCEKAFGAKLAYQAVVWEDSHIVVKNGTLMKQGGMFAAFNEAALYPSFSLKKRELGGTLKIKGLRIVNRKTESQNLPSPSSPTLPFLSLNLKTIIEGGEVFLYDYLGTSPLFQCLHFDLEHQTGKKNYGWIAFDWGENEQKLKTHFWRVDDVVVRFKTEFNSHSFPALYELIAYFFHAYMPEPMTHWILDAGKLTGNLELALHNGVPMRLKGAVDLTNVHAENVPLELIGEVDQIQANLDIDFSSVKAMNGEFILQGGRLALDKTAEFWQGLWDLRNLHTQVCIKEGKLERTVLRGIFMGMDGELLLDWQSPHTLIRMGFEGYAGEISTLFPAAYQANFREAFADDHFNLNASVYRSGEGLELEGTLAIKGKEEHVLSFGCLFGQGKEEVEVVPENLPFSLSRSVDSFLDHVADQFCLSQKRFGWFSGNRFPLEKFLSPFLFANVRMEAFGLADFQGTFDERYLVISYEGANFRLESPHFSLRTDCLAEGATSDVAAVHYLDLQTWSHVGFLPLQNAAYYQKNRDLIFENGRGMVHFENRLVHIQDVEVNWNRLELKGCLEIEARALDDVDLTLCADYLSGPASDAQRILSHFSDSVFWEIPFQGEVEGSGEVFSFRYHFAPSAELVSGCLQGNFKGHIEKPFLKCEGKVSYDMSDIVLDIATDLCSFHGTVSKSAIALDGEGVSFHADRLEEALHVSAFLFGAWEGEGELQWRGKEIVVSDFFLREKGKKGECVFSGLYNRENKKWMGELKAFRWNFGETLSIWEPWGEIFGSGTFDWSVSGGASAHLAASFRNLQFGGIHFGEGKDLSCTYSSKNGVTIEGLEVEIPTEKGVEKYKLGRFFYDLNQQKFLLEGFDFSLPPEKLPWITELAGNLFPGKVHPIEWVEALKQNEPLEGRVSLEVYPDKVWVYLTLKDGTYYFLDNQINLKNFLLLYDPFEFNIWTKVYYRDNYYWIHLLTDSMTMSRGKLEISESELSPENPAGQHAVIADWSRGSENGFIIRRLKGNFHGLQCDLHASCSAVADQIVLDGTIGFDVVKVRSLLCPESTHILDRLSISGGYALNGTLSIPKTDFSRLSFSGTLTGSDFSIAGVELDHMASELMYCPDHVVLKNLNIKDWAGCLSVVQADIVRETGAWALSCEKLKLEDVRLSRLKSPWTRWSSRDKPFFRSFFIRKFDLSNFHANLNEPESFTGKGSLDFTNLPKKTLFSNLLFIPTEITARIGLDLTNLIPVRGTIDYRISDGKIYFNEFKDMYSDGKRSRFYLAEGTTAYVDFDGNLNFKLKMKQYNLLMKLAEFFTISVKGTLLNPNYTFSNQFEDD